MKPPSDDRGRSTSRASKSWRSIAFTISALSGMTGCQNSAPPTAVPRVPAVVVANPFMREVADYEDFVGRTAAIRTVEVRARVSGYLDKVVFTDGKEVKENDILFEIDPRTYEAEVNRTKASAVQAKAHYDRLGADYRRAQGLLAREALPRQDFDLTAGDYAEAGAAIGMVVAQVKLAELNLEFCKVRAPIAGRLSRRMVDPGNIVQQDVTPLTSIVSYDPMYVYFDIDERTLLKIRRLIAGGYLKSRAQGGEFPVYAALADEREFPHVGKLDFTENRLDTSTGTLEARAQLPNPEPRVLSPGLYMKVRLPVGPARPAKLVPEEAFSTDQGQRFLYVVKTRPKKSSAGVGPASTGPAEKGAAEKAEARPASDAKASPGELEEYVVQQVVKVGKIYYKQYREVLDDKIGMDDRIVVSGLQRIRPNAVVKAELKPLENLPPATAGTGPAPKETERPKAGE